MKVDIFIEFNGNKTDQKQLLETAKDVWKSEGNKVKDLATVELYFKPEEQKCYYILNAELNGSFDA